MGLLKRFFNQTRKPEGVLGALMLRGMNSGHGELADWGFGQLPTIQAAQVVDLGCVCSSAIAGVLAFRGWQLQCASACWTFPFFQ